MTEKSPCDICPTEGQLYDYYESSKNNEEARIPECDELYSVYKRLYEYESKDVDALGPDIFEGCLVLIAGILIGKAHSWFTKSES